MYEIDFLRKEKVLRWRLRGFWTEETALAFRDALVKKMAEVRSTCPRFGSLSDTRDFPVQSGAVMKILASDLHSSTSEGSRKMAIVVSTTLNQLQAERSFNSDAIRVFRDEQAALAWLTEPPAHSQDKVAA